MTPETPLAPFLSLGLGGVLAVGMFWLLYHLICNVIPAKEAAYREDLHEARRQFLTALDTSEKKFLISIESHSERMERVSAKMAEKIEEFAEAVREMEKR